MTEAHYADIQRLIKRELKGRFESSGWFALCLMTIGMASTIAVTILGTDITEAARRGELETAGWFLLAFGIFCLLVHFFGSRRNGGQRAQDIIDMMDRYNIEVRPRISLDATVPASADGASTKMTT
jgi:hypothetical protein